MQLFLHICRGWRVLLALALTGLVLGAGVGAYKNAETSTSGIRAGRPNAEYELYSRLYEAQKNWMDESVYLNLDPDEAYTASICYLLKTKPEDGMAVSALYSAALNENGIIDELLAASGLSCTPQALGELVSVECLNRSRAEIKEEIVDAMAYSAAGNLPLRIVPAMQAALQDASVREPLKIVLTVTAPGREACLAMLEVMDRRVQEINRYAADAYGAEPGERLVSACEKPGAGSELEQAKKLAAQTLADYRTKMTAIQKTMTADEKAYYETPAPAAGGMKTVLKWALMLAVTLCMLGVFGYALAYLLDGHVKSAEELLAYGLHPFAVIKGSPERSNPNALDRLLMPKLRCHTDAYLAEVLGALDAAHIILCGDLADGDIAAHARSVERAGRNLSVEPLMAESAQTQRKAMQADGVVLMVHLWRTKHADLEQEIRICRRMGISILGAAVIG